MEEGRPSLTAIATATARAAHLLLDDAPKILGDNFALELSGAANEAILRANLKAFQDEVATLSTPELAQTFFRHFRALTTMRSRYVEDELEKALQLGVAQYVILGAGLDSFAYRRRDLVEVVRVFEVDHPRSQSWKQARLRELSVALPPNLTCIPLDFEQQTLAEGLRAGGYRFENPGFFSWLGVTQYLTEEAIFSTLKEVASLASGTEIICGYNIAEALLDEEGRRLMAIPKAYTAARGEPWQSFFEPARLAVRLQELGFTQVADFGPEEANARYFAGRTDGLCVLEMEHFMRARVGRT
jgi:methyltransferase (TIGR00027 family)